VLRQRNSGLEKTQNSGLEKKLSYNGEEVLSGLKERGGAFLFERTKTDMRHGITVYFYLLLALSFRPYGA